jgi:hypothetical protein
MFNALDRWFLRECYSMLRELLEEEKKLMATIDDVQKEVDAQSTVIDSAVALLDGIHQQLADAVASGDPAAVDKVVSDLKSHTDALAAAVARNTAASDEVGAAHAAGM